MIQYFNRFLTPPAAKLMKFSYQFTALGIDADYGFMFVRREKFICLSNLPTVLAETRMPARFN
jgi:hypothetical protein